MLWVRNGERMEIPRSPKYFGQWPLWFCQICTDSTLSSMSVATKYGWRMKSFKQVKYLTDWSNFIQFGSNFLVGLSWVSWMYLSNLWSFVRSLKDLNLWCRICLPTAPPKIWEYLERWNTKWSVRVDGKSIHARRMFHTLFHGLCQCHTPSLTC